MDILSSYVRRFSKLKVAHLDGDLAPHKPVLLLSVIDSIQNKEITENKIFITPELIGRFLDNWQKLVVNNKFTPNFALPFFHLRTSNFWFFSTHPGKEIALTSSRSIKSFSHLREVIAYAYISEDLFNLLMNKTDADQLKFTLLNIFLHQPTPYNLSAETPSFLQEVKSEVLNETPARYISKRDGFNEEEKFIRGAIFKREIPMAYNFTCSISGMRLIANREIQMIDACHIVPISQSGKDNISNGISLCPNLHRAFDRGLITIDEDYRVVTSKDFSESDTDYSIRAYHGKKILLPDDHHYYPSLNNLEWHRNNIFKI